MGCSIDSVLFLGKVYWRLDQPLTAIEIYEKALETYPNDVHILTGLARTYEGLNEMDKSVTFYRHVLK